MNHYLEQENKKFQFLYKQLVNTTQNIIGLEKFVTELKSATSDFSKKLQTLGERLHEQINNSGNGEGDTIICSYQQLSNYLLRLSQVWTCITNGLQSEVAKDFNIISGYRPLPTNRNLVQEGKKNSKEIEEARESMKRAQSEYWKQMKYTEQSSVEIERMLEEVENGRKRVEEFQKLFDRSSRLRESAEDAEKDYKKIIEITNQKWDHFEERLQLVYTQADLNDESRISFSKQTIFTTIKTLAQSLEGEQPLFYYYEEKFKEIDSRQKEEQKISYKEFIDKNIDKNGVQAPCSLKKEEFISFEQWKQINSDIAKVNNDQGKVEQLSGSWVLVGDILQDDERNIIDYYIDGLLNSENFTPLKEKLFQLKNNFRDQEEQKQQQRGSQSNSKQSLQFYQKTIIQLKQILQKQTARTYFTDNLLRKYQSMNQYYLQLHEDQFNDLTQIVRTWVNYIDINETYDCEEIYKLLQISIKIVKKTPNNNIKKIYLAETLSDLVEIQYINLKDIWKKTRRWQQLFQFIQFKKTEEKRKKVQMLMNQSQGSGVIRKGIGFIGKTFKQMLSQQEKIQINETEIVYLILEEINLFLISLQLPSQISSEVILNIALNQNVVQLDKEMLQKLIESQENRNNSHLRRQIHSGLIIKITKDNKYLTRQYNQYQNKVIQAMKLSLPYFNLKDQPEKLLLINKAFYINLKSKIMKFYILNDKILYSEQTHKMRNKMILNKFQVEKSNVDYVNMKGQVGIGIDQELLNVDEIISLDVQRSLHIHKQAINSNILSSLLRTYAYFNPDVSYAQGMNYIAGYLYLTFGDEVVTYRVFHSIMLNYFRPIFINDFETLKQKFYEFNRMFSVFLPELSEHFKQEKIDPSYYSASWFITMYSSVFQYSMRSALLNIIWDIFIAESWKGYINLFINILFLLGFYKVSFYILYILQPLLIKMEYEEILHFLCEIVRSEIFQIQSETELINYINKQLGQPREENIQSSLKTKILKKFKITNSLINRIENEYKSFILNFNQKLKKYQKEHQKI